MHRRGVRRSALVKVTGLALVCVLSTSGCAKFEDSSAAEFTAVPERGGANTDPVPRLPSAPLPPPLTSQPPTSPSDPGDRKQNPDPRDPCSDPDPAVIATCGEPAIALAGLPDGLSALVGQRNTGVVTLVRILAENSEFAQVDVGSGELTALALSPDYAEDKLAYAAISDGDKSRVVRIAQGDSATTVIPSLEGGSGQVALSFSGPDLIVAQGSDSKTGTVTRYRNFRGFGEPPRPKVLASDVTQLSGLCIDPVKNTIYLTEMAESLARIRAIASDDSIGSVGGTVWTWPEASEIGGCAALRGTVSVALPDLFKIDNVGNPLLPGSLPLEPQTLAEDKYGRLSGVAMISEGILLSTTTNKGTDKAGATDDRVVILPTNATSGDSRV